MHTGLPAFALTMDQIYRRVPPSEAKLGHLVCRNSFGTNFRISTPKEWIYDTKVPVWREAWSHIGGARAQAIYPMLLRGGPGVLLRARNNRCITTLYVISQPIFNYVLLCSVPCIPKPIERDWKSLLLLLLPPCNRYWVNKGSTLKVVHIHEMVDADVFVTWEVVNCRFNPPASAKLLDHALSK